MSHCVGVLLPWCPIVLVSYFPGVPLPQCPIVSILRSVLVFQCPSIPVSWCPSVSVTWGGMNETHEQGGTKAQTGGSKQYTQTKKFWETDGDTEVHIEGCPPKNIAQRMYCGVCANCACTITHWFFYNGKVNFQLRQLIAIPLWAQLCCDCQEEESPPDTDNVGIIAGL